MRERGLRDLPAQHARDLADALLALDGLDGRLGHVARRLAHQVVGVRGRRHLRQVRDHHNLVGMGEIGQDLGERDGRGTAHPGVDLVEHERLGRIRLAEDDLEREHDAAHLAARGDAAQGPRGEAGARAVQELRAGGPAARPIHAIEPLEGDLERGRAHLEPRHLGAHLGREARRGLGTDAVELIGRGGEPLLGDREGTLGALLRGTAVRRGVEDVARLVPAPEHVLYGRPVGA